MRSNGICSKGERSPGLDAAYIHTAAVCGQTIRIVELLAS